MRSDFRKLLSPFRFTKGDEICFERRGKCVGVCSKPIQKEFDCITDSERLKRFDFAFIFVKRNSVDLERDGVESLCILGYNSTNRIFLHLLTKNLHSTKQTF
jgi:hypothetical protein